MALLTQNIVKAKRRAFSAVKTFNLSSSLSQVLSALFQEISQKYGAVDLQVVELDNLGTTDQVVADAPCKLYGLFLKGGSAGGDYRSADHASSAATPTTTIPVAVSGQVVYAIPAGKSFTTGLTVDASQANAWTGFAIIGAP